MQIVRWLPLILVVLLVACSNRSSTIRLVPTVVSSPISDQENALSSAGTPTTTHTPATPVPASTSSPVPSAIPSSTATPVPTEPPLPSLTPEPSPTPSLTATSTATATSDPYAAFSITGLREASFGQEGEITILDTLEETAHFTRYAISFPSDGLTVRGFMNVPMGQGPFPVVIVNHGYMPPESYQTLTYTTKYTDVLANAGFLTIHPNFRNHRGSDYGENPFRIGYARDLLHLISMAQRLVQADGGPVGLWGHSMGGGVALRVLTISDQVGAAVLYGSMSGDEAKNYEAIMQWSNGEAARNGGLPEPPSNEALYQAISPINYVDAIRAPIAIHHGVLDDQVPHWWSEKLAQRLDEAGVPYDFYSYPDQNHNFTGAAYDLLNERVIAFFREHLGSD